MEPTEPRIEKQEAEPIRLFAVGEEVTVARTVVDSENRKIGENFEDGWKVVAIGEHESGQQSVTVQFDDEVSDQILTKKYLSNKLSEIQTNAQALDEDTHDALEIAASKSILGLDKPVANEDFVAEVAHIEEEIDQHSLAIEAEAIEHGAEKISFEEAQKIGEPTVENAGIEDPTTAAAKHVFETISADIRAETAQGLRIATNGLGENANSIKAAENSFLNGITASTARLESVLRNYENYPVNSIQTEIRQTIDALNDPLRAGGILGEQTLNEIQQYKEDVEETLTHQAVIANTADENFTAVVEGQSVEGVVPAISAIETTRNSLSELSKVQTVLNNADVVTQNTLRGIRLHTDRLNTVLTQSYSYPINVDDLYSIVTELKKLSVNEETRNVYKDANDSVNVLLNQVVAAVGQLEK